MAFKRIFRKYLSPKVHVGIWLILLIRLAAPVTFETGFHFIEVPPASEESVADTAVSSHRATAVSDRVPDADVRGYIPASVPSASSQVTGEAPAAQPARTNIRFDADPEDILLGIWILGILFGALLLLRGYEKLRRDVADRMVDSADPLHLLFQECMHEAGISRRVFLAVQNELAGPALMFPNIVLLPEEMLRMSPEKTKMALRHELTHFVRGDHIKSAALLVLRTVWWFNPFVWLAVKEIREDMETACDSDVVGSLSKRDKAAYANTVLSMFGRTETNPAVLGMAFGGARKNAEKRIRGIYMKQKSRPGGKAAAAMLAGILGIACFTTACQPTPTAQAVVGQQESVPSSALIGTPEPVDPKAPAAPIAEYSAAEHWSETIDKADNFKVTADIDILMPDVEAYPVEKIAPRELTQELADQLIDYFAPDAEFYRTGMQRTRAEWEELILGMRETLAEDEARGDEDAVIQDKATLEDWTLMYEKAPEKSERQPASKEYTYLYDELSGEPIEGNGPNYISISTEGEDGSIRQFDVRRRDDTDESQWPYFMYTNANWQLESMDLASRENAKTTRDDIETLEEPLRSEELERRNELDAEIERRLALYDSNTISEQAAREKAQAVLEALSVHNVQIASCEKALIGPYTGFSDGDYSDGSQENLTEPGMYLTFTRENGGIPCMERESQMIDPSAASDSYSAPFRPESGWLLLDQAGTVRCFAWESPSEAVEILAPDSELIGLSEAKERLVEELYRTELGMSEEYLYDHVMEYKITEMKLVMGYTQAENAPDDALAIPAWYMEAEGAGEDENGNSVLLNHQTLMISALDGRPILMANSL